MVSQVYLCPDKHLMINQLFALVCNQTPSFRGIFCARVARLQPATPGDTTGRAKLRLASYYVLHVPA